jgi:hypothetical protein
MARAERDLRRKREGAPEEQSSVKAETRTVARGKAARTPFVALATVATLVWLVAGLVTAAVLLLWWLL